MLVFAALTPHSPLLVPTIGRGGLKKLAKTRKAFDRLSASLKAARPDTIVIISPHGPALHNAITLNLHEAYEGDLSEFGDIGTHPRFLPDPRLAEHIRRAFRNKKVPLCLASSHTIDYGVTVPLLLLDYTKKIVPLGGAPDIDFKTHFKIGEILKEELTSSPKRIALIASSDLSHRLSSDAPAGFSPRGKEFDAALQESLETKNVSRLLALSPELVREASPCGFPEILMFLGALADALYEPRTLAYEAPFGIGYLTMELALSSI